jgi:thymidylate kinase
MQFIVIEGDNGTGKDTVGKLFQEQGFFIPTYTQEAKLAEEKARSGTRQEQTQGFLAYAELCGNIAQAYDKSLIVRYWMSTIAAAYADAVFTFDEAMSKAKDMYQILPVPTYVFYLTCDFKNRIERIDQRNITSSDDRTIERGEKYKQISDEISTLFSCWYTIDNTGKSPEEEVREMFDIIKNKEMIYKV